MIILDIFLSVFIFVGYGIAHELGHSLPTFLIDREPIIIAIGGVHNGQILHNGINFLGFYPIGFSVTNPKNNIMLFTTILCGPLFGYIYCLILYFVVGFPFVVLSFIHNTFTLIPYRSLTHDKQGCLNMIESDGLRLLELFGLNTSSFPMIVLDNHFGLNICSCSNNSSSVTYPLSSNKQVSAQ